MSQLAKSILSLAWAVAVCGRVQNISISLAANVAYIFT